MRKLVSILAATTLLASSLALAETNSNDVLQTIPQPNDEQTMTVAEADQAAPAATEQKNDADKPVVKKKKHCKRHCKKLHKKHHRMHKSKSASQLSNVPQQ